jgi:GTP-binding protein HflX
LSDIKLFETENKIVHRDVLVGANTGRQSDDDFEVSMQELRGLTKACDIEPLIKATQNLSCEDSATYIGSGKVEEVRNLIQMYDADLAIFNNTLSPSQLTNLSKALNVEVLDRTGLILNIFAMRARTREARLQVDYAKLKYMLPRLVGLRANLSRQGGTGGSLSNKGSGEKQIELDRRKIEKEMTALRKELSEVEKTRALHRSRRTSSGIPLVALVGYTNAGKSTLMNKLIDLYGSDDSQKVFVQDMLFATLDTTVRKLRTNTGRYFLLSDTVGFINDLPTDLVNAFHSTLEEALYADLILEVVDSSDQNHPMHSETTDRTLAKLGAGAVPRITVMNKADKLDNIRAPRVIGSKVYISAKEGIGIKELTDLIEETLNRNLKLCTLRIPYDHSGIENQLRSSSQIVNVVYEGSYIEITAYLDDKEHGRYSEFII